MHVMKGLLFFFLFHMPLGVLDGLLHPRWAGQIPFMFSCSFSFPPSLLSGHYGVTMKWTGAVFLLVSFGLLFVSHTLLFFQMTIKYHVNIIIGRKKDQVVSSEVAWIHPGLFISTKWAISVSKVHNHPSHLLTTLHISSSLQCINRCYPPLVRRNSTDLTVISSSVLKTVWIDTLSCAVSE